MKKNGSRERKRERREKDRKEDVEHSLLRVLRADLDDLFAVGHGCLGHTLELDVCLDELDRAIRAGGHRLRGRTGEPVDHRAARDEPEQKRRV
jgi:hypothetical protein